LRVLFVNYNDFTSASVKQAYWFAEQLVASGHDALLTCHGDPRTPQRENIDRVDRPRLVYHRFLGRRLSPVAVDEIRAFAPTVIHAWNPQVPVALATRIYRRATGAPFFVHWEDDDWTMRKGIPGRPPHRVVGFKVRRALAPVLPGIGRGSSNFWVTNWIRRDAAGLDALTPALAEEVELRLQRRCAVLLPVTPADAQNAQCAPELSIDTTGKLLVTYTGSIGPASVEDLMIALEAIALLGRAGRQVSFVHAGVIAARYDTARMMRKAGVSPGSVAFLGYVPFEQVPGLLARSDVLIQPGPPSRFNRLRLPSKLQAYLASGTPTITFAAGFGEMLEDRNEVLKLHSADPAELADRLAEIMDDPELARRLAVGARKASDRLFDRKTNTEALLAHYRAALRAAPSVNGY